MERNENDKKADDGKDKDDKEKKKEKQEENSEIRDICRKNRLLREISGKDGAEEKAENDIPHELDHNPLYHGLIPQEDLSFILSEVGDFVIRCMQTKAKKYDIVVSVVICKQPSHVKHIRIHRVQNKDGKIEWFASERYKYTSMKELIDDYVKTKRPIHPDVSQSVLLCGIGLQTWEFRHSDIKLKNLLGEGQFACVYQGEIIAGPLKKRVAIKKAHFTKEQETKEITKEIYRELMHEARLMRVFDHPNVAKCHGIAVTELPLLVVLELVDGGALYKYLRKNQGKIPREEKMLNMCYGTAKGLYYLHENKCIHRDIASRNIFYTNNKIAKISDFGLSRIGEVYTMKKGKKIPIKWTAPETVAALIYTQKTDVFSYSIFLWEVYTDGDEPYEGLTHMEIRQRVGCGARLDRPLDCPKYMFFLMRKCWEQNPDERFNMKQVVRFFEEYLDRKGKRKGQDTEAVTNIAAMDVAEAGDKAGKKDYEELLSEREGDSSSKSNTDTSKIIRELEKTIERLRAITREPLPPGTTTDDRLILKKETEDYRERQDITADQKKSYKSKKSAEGTKESRLSSNWSRSKKAKSTKSNRLLVDKLALKPQELQTLLDDLKRIKENRNG